MKAVLTDTKKCTGCGACVNKCPRQCITMEMNEEGFRYPQIEEEACVKCGQCVQVCPVDKAPEKSHETKAYICQTKEEKIWKTSSSAGIFSLLATEILNRKGVVFGAAFTEAFDVKHVVIEDLEDLEKLKRSKYVQSDIGDSYSRAKEYLDAGRYVLFTGTACQISGLKSFLKRDYERLYTQDLVCHGVPGPGVWERYKRKYLQNGKIADIQFRDKSLGWFAGKISFIYKDGRKCTDNGDYLTAFLKGYLSRESCYQCQFRGMERESDITLSDCWGWNKIVPDYDPSKGISVVLLHSARGMELFTSIKQHLTITEATAEKALEENEAAWLSPPRLPKRDMVFRMYQSQEAMDEILHMVLKKSFIKRVLLSIMNDDMKRKAHQIMEKIRKAI